jgi:inner membrane transporter RhtA
MRPPPHAYFGISALFHYLGPAFAVLLFAHVDVLGVAWLRNASGALVLLLWRRPWRFARSLPAEQVRLLLALGVVLAAMNAAFYLAIARLPLGTVGAIELLGSVGLASFGIRSRRNLAALALVTIGAALLADLQWGGQPIGVLLALANCALFVVYVILGHRLARDGSAGSPDRLGLALLVAALVLTPWGVSRAGPAFRDPPLLAAGVGVGVCSSVVPYVCDQLAMARLERATFALLLALLPAVGTVLGAIVLHQLPTRGDLAGIALVIGGVAVHREA